MAIQHRKLVAWIEMRIDGIRLHFSGRAAQLDAVALNCGIAVIA